MVTASQLRQQNFIATEHSGWWFDQLLKRFRRRPWAHCHHRLGTTFLPVPVVLFRVRFKMIVPTIHQAPPAFGAISKDLQPAIFEVHYTFSLYLPPSTTMDDCAHPALAPLRIQLHEHLF
jgi:hypothetical protein